MLNRRALSGLPILVAYGFSTEAFAHALPDSTLLFVERNGVVSIEIEMPLPELKNASSKFALELTDSKLNEELQAYFEQHLKLVSKIGVKQKLEFIDAEKSKRKDDHVGVYEVILARLAISQSGDFKLHESTLITDIIMHQVPNHSLTLRWQNADGQQQDFGRVSFDVLRKSVSPHVIIKP